MHAAAQEPIWSQAGLRQGEDPALTGRVAGFPCDSSNENNGKNCRYFSLSFLFLRIAVKIAAILTNSSHKGDFREITGVVPLIFPSLRSSQEIAGKLTAILHSLFGKDPLPP